ncbi:hypothetical protein [Ornithinimicrobium flavum]|uniref:ABC transporter ATP-binding protein C-terminal domain-containing protein n=1 Tax=Ornithinimicrobium flavum TaxID=1288636 RepID=UPI003B837957
MSPTPASRCCSSSTTSPPSWTSARVLVLKLGELLADGPAEQVRQDERVRAAYLGETLDELHAEEGTA